MARLFICQTRELFILQEEGEIYGKSLQEKGEIYDKSLQ